MSSLNKVASVARKTQNAVSARNEVAERQLVRMTLANMLWEGQFYVDGKSTAEAITGLVGQTSGEFVAKLAKAARSTFKLRHIPLLLMRELARNGRLQAEDLNAVIQRPDEMGEFLSIYWNKTVDAISAAGTGYRKGPARAAKPTVSLKKTPISNQVKKGLALAFSKFNEYQLAKWDKNSASISVRDVMFLTHPKPQNAEQEALFKRVASQTLATPDTWETELSAGADKRETFERLMSEKKLGALAFLRNLRNMVDSGISAYTITQYGATLDASKVLPFRYIAAYRIVPQFRAMLESMMFASLASHAKLPGKTKLYVDVSGSMFGTKVSAKSDLDRFDAAAALAVLAREICEEVEIYSFSDYAVRIANSARGLALVELLSASQRHSGTNTGQALRSTAGPADRILVFTDEQAQGMIGKPAYQARGYVVNVGAYQYGHDTRGVSHGDWTTVTGFSEAVVDYIQALESDTFQLFN